MAALATALATTSGVGGVRLLSLVPPPRRLSLPPTSSSSIRLFCASSTVTSQEEEKSRTNGAGELKSLSLTPPPKLTVKERKELASYAHSLGKKLKSQQVGKSGVTPSLAASFVENLESNELLKLKVHGTCPGELIDVIKQLEAATGSVAIDQIGRSVILYRPSLSKMKKREAASARRSQGSPAKIQRKWQPSGVSD